MLSGLPDLDGRPARPPWRMKAWVERCAKCGYCATDISQPKKYDLPVAPLPLHDELWFAPAARPPSGTVAERRDSIQSVVRSTRYRAQLHNRSFPKLANSFWCESLVDEAEERYGDAALAALRAAWVCDDAVRFKRARECRARVVELIDQAFKANRWDGIFRTRWGMVKVDPLRRIGSFDSAAAICREAFTDEPGQALRNVLQFQLELINRRYTAAYSLSDAMHWSPSAWGVEQSIGGRAPRERSWLSSALAHGMDFILGNA